MPDTGVIPCACYIWKRKIDPGAPAKRVPLQPHAKSRCLSPNEPIRAAGPFRLAGEPIPSGCRPLRAPADALAGKIHRRNPFLVPPTTKQSRSPSRNEPGCLAHDPFRLAGEPSPSGYRPLPRTLRHPAGRIRRTNPFFLPGQTKQSTCASRSEPVCDFRYHSQPALSFSA